jgi:L-asparaginase/Glu-tRNA(Gln) amidotransferase subunit D
MVDLGAKGIVIASFGEGTVSDVTDLEIARWTEQKFPIVIGSKT